jgi:pyruvate, orthophosphate dikinase
MLGHRGVRLGITFPEIYTMQIRAVLEAAATCVRAGVECTRRSWCRRSAPRRS